MEPGALEHPELGRLVWDERLSRYQGKAELDPGREVDVTVDPFTNFVPGQAPASVEDPAALVGLAAERFGWLREHLDELSAYAAAEMLDDHNDGDWCEGAPIDAAEFVRRMTITDVAFTETRSFEAYYDDGDLFWGHAILVRVDEDGRPEHAEFFG